MDSLPIELLSRIFTNLLPPNVDDALYQVDDPPEVQATISCVCQRWNQIAESTPELWTFVRLSRRTRSKDVVKRRLALSGNLPLHVSIRVAGWEPRLAIDDLGDASNESFQEMHALLVEQVVRWRTLRVESRMGVPSELRQWIPSELPNVVGLSLSLLAHKYAHPNDMESRGPFISAPCLTFCCSDSPVSFPFTYCPLLKEYHVSGIGLKEMVYPLTISLWRAVVAYLFEKCPRLEVLQVQATSRYVPASDENVCLGDWPVLPSLITLRFADGATAETISYFLTELKVPRLRRVEFQGYLLASDLNQETRLPLENNGRMLVSRMPIGNVIELLEGISTAVNAVDLQVELDVDGFIDGHPRYRESQSWESRRSPAAMSELREWWESIPQIILRFSWVVPSDEGEGGWKRLGGAELSFDDAVAYLDRGRDVWLKT
ncbi:hypothetical protein FS837_012695 [Tulasnella sp. UAMH 9824]|nr:hypothetical protein FS837_012695 [Tulasnella sp. UAMH 9824]